MRIQTAAYMAIALHFLRGILRKVSPDSPGKSVCIRALVPLRDSPAGHLTTGTRTMFITGHMSDSYVPGDRVVEHDLTYVTVVIGTPGQLSAYARERRLAILPVDIHEQVAITGDRDAVRKVRGNLEANIPTSAAAIESIHRMYDAVCNATRNG